jgi:ubiquinone/menaquinone biosynthesis C-methylase UbiE
MKRNFASFAIWEKTGVTEHMGGVPATQHLLDLCGVVPGMSVLDIGCGTGYTACLLAKNYQTRVVAVDVSPRIVEKAQERVFEKGLDKDVALIQADAHCLPFPDDTFDVVVAESVLVFCQVEQAASELLRVLKPAGVLGANELTFLMPPPAQLSTLLFKTLGIHTFQERDWQSIFQRVGFVDVSSTVQKTDLWAQAVSHVKVDGIKRYLAASYEGFADATIRGAFFNKDMLVATLRFASTVGYGVYTGRKAHRDLPHINGDRDPF